MNGQIERPVLRSLANVFTLARPLGAAAISRNIIKKGPDFRSWRLSSALSLVLASDKADGFCARRSGIKSEFWAAMDQRMDKATYDLLMYNIGVATCDTRYFVYALTNDARNVVTESYRKEMKQYGIPGGARLLGKAKTTIQTAALVADVSPLGESYPDFVHDLHKISVGLTVVSGIDIVNNAHREMNAARNLLHSLGVNLPPAV